MAEGTYYAWSPIRYGGKPTDTEAAGQPGGAMATDVQYIQPGDTVDQGALDISEEDFQELIDSGAIRLEEYPKDVPANTSVRDYKRQLAAESGQAFETTGGTALLTEVEQQEVARAAQLDVEEAEQVPEEEEPDAETLRLARMPIVEGKDLSAPAEEQKAEEQSQAGQPSGSTTPPAQQPAQPS